MGFSVSYAYEIIDRYSGKLAKIRKETDRYRKALKKVSKSSKKFGDKMKGMQSDIATVAGVIGGGLLLGKFNDFEQTMNKLNAVTLASDEQMVKLRETAKTLGATTQFSASQAAEAMVFLGMAGLDTDKILKAIPDTLKLGASAGLDLASAADIATNVLAQMGFEVGELSRVNDVLAIAQAKANFNVTELFEAMRPSAVTAKNLGISLEELTAVLGVMANAGEKGGIAGTLFRNALTKIAGASRSQLGLYRKLGIDMKMFVDETGKIKNFKGFVDKLKDLQNQGKLTIPILQKLFGERGFRAMQVLIGAGGAEIGKLQTIFEASGGAADKMANIMMKGLPGVMKILASTAEAVNIAVFESGLDKFLIGIFSALSGLLSWLSKTHPWILKTIAVFGLLAVVIGPILMAVGMFAIGIGALTTALAALAPVFAIISVMFGFISIPVLLVVGAIALLVAGFILIRKNWSQVVDVVGGTISEMILMLNRAIGDMAEFWWKVRGVVGGTIAEMVLMVENGIARITGFISKVKGLFGGGSVDMNIASENAKATSGSINGSIQVSAGKGSKIDRAGMETSFGGNLGMNMASAH